MQKIYYKTFLSTTMFWGGVMMFVQDYCGLERWIEHERNHWWTLSPWIGGLIAAAGFIGLVSAKWVEEKNEKKPKIVRKQMFDGMYYDDGHNEFKEDEAAQFHEDCGDR